ncbi:hypothetical protein BCO18175_02332 [Burkholderia contaminans]|uniref:hypothetical protein n=1 Tax=Burkholderia contaminans TaxID=488447 RepID=UPI001454186F|nr:hypothetical protein [Burkholderia contaminans]VWC75522.1 hypothetical protein BCO18175_02332 [Burkholderia contaminans]
MSKLFTLKEWLTVPEAARHLTRLFNEEVAESDILRLAIDGRLKLSVHFVNHTYANPGKVVGEDEIEWRELPSLAGKDQVINFPDGLEIGDGRWLKLDERVVKLQGIWDLPMIGAETLDIEHEYQRLTGGPEVTLQNIEGAFVEGESGLMCRLCEHFDHNEYQAGSIAHEEKLERYIAQENLGDAEIAKLREIYQLNRKEFRDRMAARSEHERYYPSAGLPRDGVLVVRSRHLTAFTSSLEDPKAKSDDQSMSAKERSSAMKIIATLVSLSGLKGGTYKQAEGIANAAKDLGISVSVNTVDKFLKESSSIEKEKTQLK